MYSCGCLLYKKQANKQLTIWWFNSSLNKEKKLNLKLVEWKLIKIKAAISEMEKLKWNKNLVLWKHKIDKP
jgi:hypothetical protein